MNKDRTKGMDSPAPDKTAPASVSRRKLLKMGGAAMPAVLTLHSGSALAQSSLYVGDAGDGVRYMDKVLCLDTTNAEPLGNGRTFKFVDANYVDVNVIPDGEYYPTDNSSGDAITADQHCRTGGVRYLKGSGFHRVEMPTDGIIMSATALSSLTYAVGDTKINYLP